MMLRLTKCRQHSCAICALQRLQEGVVLAWLCAIEWGSEEGSVHCREGRAWVSPSGISSGCEGHAPLLERMQRTCIARLAAASEVEYF